MQEYICSQCGYRKLQKDMFDHIVDIPIYPNFAANNLYSYINPSVYENDNKKCPNCGKTFI